MLKLEKGLKTSIDHPVRCKTFLVKWNKIEEDYSLYDQPIDDDDNDDEALEPIPEEDDAEDEDDKGDGTKKRPHSRSPNNSEGNNGEIDSENEEIAHYFENQDEDSEEETDDLYKAFEENKTLVKIQDKIKLLRHRCEAGLGYTLCEKAYKLIKNYVKNPSGASLRDKLITIIGEDNIGFWVIFDNIMFLEGKKKQLKK